ncbi:MAG TPA: S8 family serine peptidase, partial [Candidatus Saccharimonadales bacterium]|nr:S8 family serine peptidase [Candidatus Saccharimonadales bacterium]
MKNFCSAGLALLLSVSFILAQAQEAAHHKIQVRDAAAAQAVVARGGRMIADYGSYQLYDAPGLGADVPDRGEVRDNYNFIRLNAETLDTSQPRVQARRQTVGNFAGKHLHLVHFAGPVQPAWRKALLDAGLQIVSYIPQNAYLVYGDAPSIGRMQSKVAGAAPIQWEAPYLDNYKIHPRARLGKTDQFAIQLMADPSANAATLKLIDQLKLAPIQRQRRVLHFVDVVVRLPPASLNQIAARPDVISIQPRSTPKKFDERQDQIIAGALSRNSVSNPGYLAWLASVGFTQAQFDSSAFAIDISDSGIDNGTTSPNHFGLYAGGDVSAASRVIYNRLEGQPNAGSTLAGCDGHGNLNAHIAMGYDAATGFPFADNSGYRYGLGVCPFARIGCSVIFDPDNFTNPNYTSLLSRAYDDSARISNNSWGDADNDGTYNMDSQEYDALVRDAQPSISGNQEMVIVFAVGNDGTNNPHSISPPSTAKNVITVGAAQNDQPFGASDGCDTPDSQANNANAVLDFSGRGPCDDGRRKPELVAPGSHITGGAPQAPNPGPYGTG